MQRDHTDPRHDPTKHAPNEEVQQDPTTVQDDGVRYRAMPEENGQDWTPEDRPEEKIDNLPEEYQIQRPA